MPYKENTLIYVWAVGASLAWGFSLVVDQDWPLIRMVSFSVAMLLTFLTINAIF